MRPCRLWLLALPLVLAACGASLPDRGAVQAPAGRPLRVGVVAALSGPLTAESRGIVNAATLAAEQAGTVRGHAIEIVTADGGCAAEPSAAAAAELAREPRLLGIVGPVCSPGCVAAERVLGTPAIVMITPRCTDIAVTRQGYRGVFRTSFTDAVEAVGAAAYVEDTLHIGRVFIVNDGTVYGKGLRDVFELVFGKSRLAGNEEALTGSTDYGPVIRAVQQSSAGLVYYAGFAPDAARFVSQLRGAGVTLPVMAPDAVKDAQAFIAAAGGAAEGVYVTEPVAEPGPAYETFAAAYRARYGSDPGAYAAEAYDAVALLLRAARRTAEQRAEGLRIDRRALISAIADTDVEGASGRIRFRPNGDRTEGAAVRVLRVRGDRFEREALVRPE